MFFLQLALPSHEFDLIIKLTKAILRQLPLFGSESAKYYCKQDKIMNNRY